MVDIEINKALRAQYNPDGSVLRKAQLRMLEMLTYLDGVCRENSIEYWLESGTLLGAVRHGGFIPWDDDVDIIMTRKDAKKLGKILRHKKDNTDFVYQCHENDPYHYVFWNKLRDLKSAYVIPTYWQDHLKYKGLSIDIFTLDDNIIDWLQEKCIFLNHHMIFHPLADNCGKWALFRPLVPIFHFFLRNLVFPLARFLSLFRKNDYLNYSYGQPWKRKYPIDAIYPLREIKFEGRTFMSPTNPEKYLRVAFNDWNHIPPEDKRQTHASQFELFI